MPLLLLGALVCSFSIPSSLQHYTNVINRDARSLMRWAEQECPPRPGREALAHVPSRKYCSQTGTEDALTPSLVCTLLYEVAVIELDKYMLI